MLVNTEAFVLKNRKYNEADSLLVLFARSRGRISAVAKGARRAKSQMLAGIQTFSCSNFLLYQGRNMYTVNQVEAVNTFYSLREDYRRLTYASYLAELVDTEITEEQAHPQLFNLFGTALTLLNRDNVEVEALVRSFELHYMKVCGYEPNLFSCTVCQMEKDAAWYFSLSQGGIVCPVCRLKETHAVSISDTCLKLARYLLSKDMKEVQRLKIHTKLNDELHRISRQYLQYHTGRNQFKSLRLLHQVDDVLSMPVVKEQSQETRVGNRADQLTDEVEFDTFNKDQLKNEGNEGEE